MIELSRTGKLVVLGVAVPTTAALLYWLLKPFKDEEYDNRTKNYGAATSRQTIIEMKVPRKDVGIVIGRQGAMIKQLQEETGAKLNFKVDPHCDSEDRTMVIRGTPETAQAAECAVRKLLADCPVIVQEEMLVPGYAVGRIIGRGGENIRQMSRSSQAKIHVDRTREGYRDEPRLITISGTAEQIEVAKNLLQETIQEEDELRARNAVAVANREERKTSKGSKHESHGHVTNTDVSSMNEIWDLQNSSNHGDDVAMKTNAPSTQFPRVPDFVEVYVSAVAYPGHFWVQKVSAMGLKLDELVQQMTRYYDMQKAAVTSVKVGDIVAAPLEGDASWYRAQVMGVNNTQLDLFYVDYGDSTFMDIARVKQIKPMFLTLPLQAVECRLAGVKPNGDWTEESIDTFERLTHCANWKVIMARAEKFTEEIPHLTLIDTNGDTDVNVNEEIVSLGYGVSDTVT